MIELTPEEERWLVIFAKDNPFFNSLLEFYEKNDYLTEDQYECLENDIEEMEAEGKQLLSKTDVKFLKAYAQVNEILRQIFDSYNERGYLDAIDIDTIIDLKSEMSLDYDDGISSFLKMKADKMNNESKRVKPNYELIRKICPHCSARCLPKQKYCGKCGEPLREL